MAGRRRVLVILSVMAAGFAVIAGRLVWIQGPGSDQYLAVGRSEWTHQVVLAADRGAILDRNGAELAMSIPQSTVYADPHQVTDPRGEAAVLAPVLGIDAATLQGRLSADAGFVYLARTIPDAEAATVTRDIGANRLPGVYTLQEPKRFYPAGQLASPLLGTVGTDGGGLGGLESMYNSTLDGRAGSLAEETDPEGGQLPGGLRQFKAAVRGQDVVLTIDESLQYQTEQALAQAIVAAQATSGIALLMDTRTGDLLADANLTMPGPGTTTVPAVPVAIPSPATRATTAGTATAKAAVPATGPQPVEAPSASAFTQVYEPGSVNKLITISAALQAGVIRPSDQLTITNTYPVAGTTFRDSEDHPIPLRWTVTDVLANSSNIGTIQIAQRLGHAPLMHYVHLFGEGSPTDIGFPYESAGLLPTYWSGTSLADVAIGQGIGVTAVQMLAAYNAMANGGVYVAPRLVAGTLDATGTEHPTKVTPGRRVVSPTVAAEMTTMLEQVVQDGTGKAAGLTPYTVAGKTGTALLPSPKGGYEAGHYVASFAGFVPAEKPAITAMVVINDTPDYGAAASAPTFATIARDALEAENIPPQPTRPPAPGVPLASASAAAIAADQAGTPLPGLTTPATVPGAGRDTASTVAAAPAPSASGGAPPTTAPGA